MTTVYLIRHAEAEGNLYRRIQGWYDALITDNGLRQIAALESRFAGVPVDGVYSSDLIRTRTTAGAIATPRGLTVYTDPGLREIHMGEWEDHTWGEIRRVDGDRLTLFNRTSPEFLAPGGESLGQVGDRVERTIRAIVRRHPDQTIALFCHGTAIRQFLANIQGVPPDRWHELAHFDNTAVTCLAWDGEAFHIVFQGDNSHLDDTTSTLSRQSWWRKGSQKQEDVNLWFRPLDPGERELYLSARRDAWLTIHGADLPFDGPGFWQGAEEDLAQTPWGVTAAMCGEEVAGLLQLSPRRFREEGAGYIPFVYMTPSYRNRGLGVQLVGQAVSFYRPLGRSALRLRCSPTNQAALGFYGKYGFVQAGEDGESRLPLLMLEKSILPAPMPPAEPNPALLAR